MRRKGRECALQLLYQMDMQGLLDADVHTDDITDAVNGFWDSFEPVEDEDRDFAERLVEGCCVNSPNSTADRECFCIAGSSIVWLRSTETCCGSQHSRCTTVPMYRGR